MLILAEGARLAELVRIMVTAVVLCTQGGRHGRVVVAVGGARRTAL